MKSEIVPRDLLRSLENVNGFNEDDFVAVHEKRKQVVSIRINPLKISDVTDLFPESTRVPWSTTGYYLAERPSFIFDPLLHAGAYYVQEASGMFLEQCIRQTIDCSTTITALDLCAAPGGKSTLIQSVISPHSLLVSNEVIKTRVSVLQENLAKWGAANVVVTNNDPRDFNRLGGFFDLMVVDAPCSGSGLFRRNPAAVEEWSTNAVETCSLRQQRILADAYDCLQKGGVLVYSTCSYSPQEDEDITDWLLSNRQVESLKIDIDPNWNIVETQSPQHNGYGYRFFPDRLKGEGFYIACFRKDDGAMPEPRKPKKQKTEKVTAAEKSIVSEWIKHDDTLNLYRSTENLFAFPVLHEDNLSAIRSHLYVKKAGITIGKLLRDELLPDHELAVSTIPGPELPRILLKKDEALQYLRKEEVTITGTYKGWALVQFNGLNLGWVKILSNRTNNYYPKEWRILKREIPE